MVSKKIQQALGRSAPYVEVLPIPVLAERAPASSDILPAGQLFVDQSVSPHAVYTSLGNGEFAEGGNEPATTSSFGIVELATLAELQGGTAPAGAYVPTANDVATVIAGVVVGAVPPANESQAGIAEIATQVETDAGTDDTRIVSPLKLATYVAGGSGNGSFVDLTATGTVSFTGATGAYSITSATASDVGVTGAGIDLTVDSAAGQLILTGGEAAANAVRIQADDAAGGIDIDSGSAGIAIDSTGAISLDAAAASNFSVSGAGVDLNLASSAGRIIATAGEDAADAIYLHANAGTSEKIRVHADQGTAADSVSLASDVGGITLSSGLASNDAINLSASAGGVDIDGALQVNIASSQNAATAIVINASAGGIDITNTGTAGEDIDIASSGASVNLSSTENAAQSIYLRANGGTSETIDLHVDQGTGVASLNLHSDVGGVTIDSGLASADAINIVASNVAGGIDINSGTAGFDVLTTGAISLDSAADSNLSVNGAFPLVVESTLGQLLVTSGLAGGDSIWLLASDAAGGVDIDSGTGGFSVDSTGTVSLDGAAASNFSVSGAGIDLTLASASGTVIVNAGENTADAIYLHANAGTSEKIRIHADQGTSADSVELESDVGGITLTSGLASADAINLSASAGGVDIDGALQVNIASSQASAGAITLSASNASGGITHTGKCIFTPDSVTSDNAGVAASVSTFLTLITTDGDSNEDNVTLADGVAGQVKMFAVVAAGNAADSIKITPANMAGGSKITFAADPTGLGCTMCFDGTNWSVVANNGGTIA